MAVDAAVRVDVIDVRKSAGAVGVADERQVPTERTGIAHGVGCFRSTPARSTPAGCGATASEEHNRAHYHYRKSPGISQHSNLAPFGEKRIARSTSITRL